jgi:hypothetical protein
MLNRHDSRKKFDKNLRQICTKNVVVAIELLKKADHFIDL